MNYLSSQEKEELGKLGKKATQGKWWWSKDFDNTWSLIATRIFPHTTIIPDVIGDITDANKAFIAAANPAAIQSLLEELEDVKRERDAFEKFQQEVIAKLKLPTDRVWFGCGILTVIEQREAERDKLRDSLTQLTCLIHQTETIFGNRTAAWIMTRSTFIEAERLLGEAALKSGVQDAG